MSAFLYIGLTQFFIGIALLVFASYSDIKLRKASDIIWITMGFSATFILSVYVYYGRMIDDIDPKAAWQLFQEALQADFADVQEKADRLAEGGHYDEATRRLEDFIDRFSMSPFVFDARRSIDRIRTAREADETRRREEAEREARRREQQEREAGDLLAEARRRQRAGDIEREYKALRTIVDSYPETPQAKRDYYALNLSLDKRLSNNWSSPPLMGGDRGEGEQIT